VAVIRCYICGRRLLHPAVTTTVDGNTGHAGRVCARRVGLLPPTMAARKKAARRPRPRRETPQLELAA
jgi:hypothetical protein